MLALAYAADTADAGVVVVVVVLVVVCLFVCLFVCCYW